MIFTILYEYARDIKDQVKRVWEVWDDDLLAELIAIGLSGCFMLLILSIVIMLFL